MIARRSRYVDDVSLGVDTHFLVEAADAADPYSVPDLVELGLVRFRGRFHDEFLEAVLLTVLASVRTRDSLGTLARDHLRQVSPS
jgi:hypothetical protein